MTNTVLTTEDNSHTLFSEQFNAHYHSIHGAIEESIHVFISAGLFHLHRQGRTAISIFEMGLGTGLNALLSYLCGNEMGLDISYESIENYPISLLDAEKLNYPELLDRPSSKKIFREIHQSEWEKDIQLSSKFLFHKINQKLEAYNFTNSYDLIFYDAFAPSCQKELWEKPIHSKIYKQLNPGAVLVTYCTQGAFRRMLVSLGYSIERLNGPGRKREMLRATKY